MRAALLLLAAVACSDPAPALPRQTGDSAGLACKVCSGGPAACVVCCGHLPGNLVTCAASYGCGVGGDPSRDPFIWWPGAGRTCRGGDPISIGWP
jgi:hypothetical protein